jgi:hypothetical protein
MSEKRQGGIFLTGKLTYEDHDFHKRYEFVPFGLVDQIVRVRDAKAMTIASWHHEHAKLQRVVQREMPKLPPEGPKYDDMTWEWTIVSRARDEKWIYSINYFIP